MKSKGLVNAKVHAFFNLFTRLGKRENARQYPNMLLEPTALVIYYPSTFFYVASLFLMAMRFHKLL